MDQPFQEGEAAGAAGQSDGVLGDAKVETVTSVAPTIVPKPQTIEEEKQIIKTFETNCGVLKLGQTWYVLSARWWKQWKEYVHFDWYSQNYGQVAPAPPPIDNSPIIDDESNGDPKIKKGAMENYDYVLLAEITWQHLFAWYGGGPALPRKVIGAGFEGQNKIVEIRLLTLKFVKSSKTDDVKYASFSKNDTIRKMRDTMAPILEFSPEDVRIWDFHAFSKYKLLEDIDKKLEESQIIDNQPILFEEKDENGQFPELPKKSAGSSSYTGYYSGGYTSSYNTPTDPGTTGLVNLGNTCFMNSSLQCLSNTQPLSDYFLAEKYKGDVNTTNVLGMKGELAEEYATLIKTLWGGTVSAVAPREFKHKLERFAPAFSGYQQHDSQELLSFLLDGLHEDLNRVKVKPYKERPETQEKGDAVFSEDLWNYHKERNDSIIVDWFQGQLKSTLVCPKCEKHSVTFDPVMYLSLPLPIKMTRVIQVTVFPYGGKRPTKYAFEVNKYGVITDLRDTIAKATDIKPELIQICDVYSSKFFKAYRGDESLDIITERDVICAYELYASSEENITNLATMHRKEEGNRKGLFGVPFIFSAPPTVNTYKQVADYVLQHCQRFLKTPPLKKQAATPDSDDDEPVSRVPNSDDDEPNKRHVKTKIAHDNSDTEDDLPIKKSPYPFTLRGVDNYGLSDEQVFPEDDTPIDFERVTAIAVVWNDADSYFDEVKEKDYVMHESLQSVVEKDENEEVKLSTCVNLFTEEEQLGPEDTWYCSNCKDHVQAFKKFDLWRLPPILVIHLKRFSYKKKYWREKLESFVDFPLHDLDLTEFAKGPQAMPPVYELYAVSNHFGSLGGGHYTAYGKNYKDNNWYKYDDSNVSRIEPEKARTSSAYVLFYRRKDTITPIPTAVPAADSAADTADPADQMDTEDDEQQEQVPNVDKMEEVPI